MNRLEEIKARLDRYGLINERDGRWLIAEVERLQENELKLRDERAFLQGEVERLRDELDDASLLDIIQEAVEAARTPGKDGEL